MVNKIRTNGFVKIHSFLNDKQREITSLSVIYDDKKLLLEQISSLISEEINLETCGDKKIFIKPNWVKHSSVESDEICLRTHDSVTLALVEYVCSCRPKSVVIGDAPIQGCKWDKMISEAFLKKLEMISAKSQVPVSVKDLRRKVMNLADEDMVNVRQGMDDFVIVDVGRQSYLEEITSEDKNQFRVTHYNPDRFIESHKPGVHKYCITKELFDADIVISVPKIKTHEKSGITNALKNIVGLNGDKDFLPHHRIGGTRAGGDAYPGYNLLRHWSEKSYDQANRNLGNRSYWIWIRIASLLWKMSFPGREARFGAGWYGNDTTWRMVMDLNLVATYATRDGKLSDEPQRLLYSLCDGIIGGQKDGPLTPEPLPLGVLMFTNDSSWCDITAAILMEMEIERLPLLQAAEAFSSERKIRFYLNNKEINLSEIKPMSIETKMPSGWVDYKNQIQH